MAKKNEKDKRRDRLEKERLKLKKQLERDEALLDSGVELPEDEIEISDDSEEDAVEKDMGNMVSFGGPTSWKEVDALEQAREKNNKIQDAAYTVQQLVSNIVYHPMLTANEKSDAIKSAGSEFGTRVTGIMDEPIKKALDMELLEAEALIAKDLRSIPVAERIGDWISKAVLTSAAEEKLSDSDFALVVERGGKKIRKYPIHDKAHVRNALARAAQMMKKGGEAGADAKAAMPKIKAAAKKMGIGMEKGHGVIVEKDASGQWRWVGFPTNNFMDWDGEILSEKAHLEYVEWVNQNMELAPVFLTWHKGGTRREKQADFVGYENGFLVTSGALTEKEAAGLFEAQKITDIGMSHGTFVLEHNGNVIEKYRMVEVSDLPLENAANPFTDLAILTKEANMDTKKYLATVLGSEELAEKYLDKAGMKQKELREAGVKEAEKVEEPKQEATPEIKEPPAAPSTDAIVAQVLKELDVEGLQEFLAKSQEAVDKVAVLEGLVKDLSGDRDNWLAEKIAPPAEKKFLWSKARASADDKTIIKEGNEEDEKLKAVVAGLPENWLGEALGVTPLAQ